jgi:hypothetical protein
MEPIVIKFKPYTGSAEEDVKGKKTVVTLNENTMEYKVNYTQKVKVTMSDSVEGELSKDSVRFVEETGKKDKSTILDVIKHVKTEYDEDGVAYKVYLLDICSAGTLLTFEVEIEKEWENLYTEISNWRFKNMKEGKTVIDWMPHGRNIVVDDDETNNQETKRLASVGLIDPSTLSDAERLALGGVSKAAEIANADSENQKTWTIVSVGPEVTQVTIGDSVLFRPGCQATSIKVGDKYYLQLGEFEVLGKFTK